MIEVNDYLSRLIELLTAKFSERLLYVGLQGSYLRGEATPDSDLDIMVIMDTLNISDLDDYRSIIESMEHFDKSCGFICSKADLAAWNPLEICSLLHTTQDCYGKLKDFTPDYTQQDIRNYIKVSLNNLYHEICHRYIHADAETNRTHLPFTYKGIFFILQNLYYLQHGQFFAKKSELLHHLSGKDHAVLNRSIELTNGSAYDFQDSFSLLFAWCQETMRNL